MMAVAYGIIAYGYMHLPSIRALSLTVNHTPLVVLANRVDPDENQVSMHDYSLTVAAADSSLVTLTKGLEHLSAVMAIEADHPQYDQLMLLHQRIPE